MRIAISVVTIAALHTSALAAPTAEDLFNDGQTAFDQGDYSRAIDRWQESYRLSKEPALLFNLGQAYNLAGDCQHALFSYEEFVAIDPTSDQRPRAEEFARQLEAKCGRPTVQHVDQVPQQIENSDSGRKLKLAGVVTAGGGAALVVTGLLFGRRASTLGDEVTDACAPPSGCDWTQAALRKKDATGRRYAAIGYTLDVLGFAAIAGGAVMYYLGNREGPVAVSPLRDGGAAVTWSGRW